MIQWLLLEKESIEINTDIMKAINNVKADLKLNKTSFIFLKDEAYIIESFEEFLYLYEYGSLYGFPFSYLRKQMFYWKIYKKKDNNDLEKQMDLLKEFDEIKAIIIFANENYMGNNGFYFSKEKEKLIELLENGKWV